MIAELVCLFPCSVFFWVNFRCVLSIYQPVNVFLLQPTLLQSLVALLAVYFVLDLKLPVDLNGLDNPQMILVCLLLKLKPDAFSAGHEDYNVTLVFGSSCRYVWVSLLKGPDVYVCCVGFGFFAKVNRMIVCQSIHLIVCSFQEAALLHRERCFGNV